MLSPEGGFVWIDGEWIEYEEVSGKRVKVKKDGRGARRTTAKDHDGSKPVVTGQTFVAILELPAAREDWGDDPNRRNQ